MKYYACDFETTSYEGITSTEVWSASFAELYQEEVTVLGNIADFMNYFIKMKSRRAILYFHNLKFDGEFIICYLLNNGYKLGHTELG